MIKKILIVLFVCAIGIYAKKHNVASASEISSIMLTAAPGDTLVMRNGFWVDQNVIFDGNGTQDKPIVLIAETPGFVVMTGTSVLRIGGNYLEVNGLYFFNGFSASGAVVEFRNGSSRPAYNCRLTNTAIVNYNPASKSTDYKWISLYGKYNRLDHCFMSGKTNIGTTVVVWLDGQPNYHQIDNNYFGYRPLHGDNGAETIRIGTSDYSMSDSYTTVEYNYFERCNGEIEIISNKSGHNTFRYNTFFESEGALTLRHGNFAEVYGNFFIGNNKSNTGGVRIIGEDHKVFNNYFENLAGSSNRSALAIMNGVPNSPLNRYFQVKRALVVNNTFVNCSETFQIGQGADSELTLPPLDCIIANNVVISKLKMIEYDATPINLFYEGNIMFGNNLGISQPEGISLIDPLISLSPDGLWRPAITSPVVNASKGTYNFVIDDFDGQIRIDINDVGADEISEQTILRKPKTAEDSGPVWYPPAELPIRTIKVSAGQDSLFNAVKKAQSGETIELISDGGVYTNSKQIELTFPVTIKGASDLTEKPVIQLNDASVDNSIFVIKEGTILNLSGVELRGTKPVKYLISTDQNPFNKHYKLFVDSCWFGDVNNGNEGNFFRAFKGTFADTIVINNSIFTNNGSVGIQLNDEAENSGKYNVDVLRIVNSTFYNIPQEALNIYGGDRVLFTIGPRVSIDHCTFDNVGYNNTAILFPKDCDNTVITNSIFSNGNGAVSLKLYGMISEVNYSNFFNVGSLEINTGAKIGENIYHYDPLYANSAQGDFTLSDKSPLLVLGNDGKSLGDLNWAINNPSYFSLKIIVEGEGTVVAEPESIARQYEPGANVKLNAVAADGYEFIRWSGDVTGIDPVANIIIDSDKNITAIFSKTTGLDDNKNIPNEFNLYDNYPNPFNPSTNIRFSVPQQSHVKLDLYSLDGSLLKTLVDNTFPAGFHEVKIDMSNYSSGVYLVRMLSNNKVFTLKLSLVK